MTAQGKPSQGGSRARARPRHSEWVHFLPVLSGLVISDGSEAGEKESSQVEEFSGVGENKRLRTPTSCFSGGFPHEPLFLEHLNEDCFDVKRFL